MSITCSSSIRHLNRFAVVMRPDEFAPVGGRATSGRNRWRLERFAQMRVDFPDRPRRRAGEEFTVVMNLLRGRVGTPEPEPAPEAAPVASRPGLLVQGVSPRGRTTLVADRLEGTAIVGDNPAFGPSRIEVTAVDKLLLGRAVGAGDEQLPFDKWRLRLAPLPRALRE